VQLCACQCCPAAAPGAELLHLFLIPAAHTCTFVAQGHVDAVSPAGGPLGVVLAVRTIILPAPSRVPFALPPQAPSLNASCAGHACPHYFAVRPLRCWPPSSQAYLPLDVSPHPTSPRSTSPSLCSWDKKFKPYTLEYAKNEDKVGGRSWSAEWEAVE